MDVEARTIRRVTARLIPFLIVCYFIAYLDRVNLGFAALQMNKDLKLSAATFGLGAGIFFLAYFALEVPSNLLLERFGARKWIARIMFTWGLCSGAMALISGTTGFYVVRLLLGAAEAGFFPGVIFFLTLWFPSAYRARIIGLFMVAIPLSSVIGAPVSGLLLQLNGVAGLRGWQWLYILEAAPALVLAVVTWFYLTDRPADAAWLAPDERAWLVERQQAERRQREAVRHYSVGAALANPTVLALALVYFGDVACLYGLGFFLPQIVKAFGLTDVQTGFVTAIPYVVGVVAIIWWGRRSDRSGERKLHTGSALFLAAAGIVAAALLHDPVLRMVCFSVAAFGIFACLATFWTLPTTFLTGPAAAGGIAIVNAVGNLSGFFGPYAVGYIKSTTGSFTGGLLLLAALGLIAMAIVLALRHDRKLERAPAPRAAQ